MPVSDLSPIRRYGLAAAAIAAGYLVGAVLILWSWNTIAIELFAAPAIAFRHALAIELVATLIAAVFAGAVRVAIGGRRVST